MNAQRFYVGCAGWNLGREHLSAFPTEGTHLQRYAAILGSVEINSSFYRPHRQQTYVRWADSVPADFRFCVKMPKRISHVRRLQHCEQELDEFLGNAPGWAIVWVACYCNCHRHWRLQSRLPRHFLSL